MSNLPARANQDIYMVNGVPISFYEIDRWYQECLKNDRALALYLGDPYNDKKSAELVAMRVFGTRVPDSTKFHNFNFNVPSYEPVSMNSIFQALEFAQKHNTQQQQQKQSDIPPQPVKQIDWQTVLSIPTDTEITPKLVKVCFRKLVRKYHPDLQNGSNEKMCQIIEARDAAYRALGLME